MAVSLWRCPKCRQGFDAQAEQWTCRGCGAIYPVFGGIPDLRVNLPHWIDLDADRRKAAHLLSLAPRATPADLVVEVFRRRGDPERDVQHRARLIVTGVGRWGRELDEWLAPATTGTCPFLDLGCGAGALLAGAADRGRAGIGIDVSLEWLVVARHLIYAHGGTPVLAAALSEALPLADGSVGGVLSLDVIEHVGDQPQYLREIERVLAPGAVCALATPNRYSLSAEPHVSVWGVGWLPRAWQKRYVRWRSGKTYEFCRLLSLPELRRLIHTSTTLSATVLLGAIPAEELMHFSPAKATLAHLYNRLIQVGFARAVLLRICPFFRVLARKAAG